MCHIQKIEIPILDDMIAVCFMNQLGERNRDAGRERQTDTHRMRERLREDK